MSRTSAGLRAIGRDLTGRLPGVERTIDPSLMRVPTLAIDRLTSYRTDLDALVSVLDRLAGTGDPSAIAGSRRVRRLHDRANLHGTTDLRAIGNQPIAPSVSEAGGDERVPRQLDAHRARKDPSQHAESTNAAPWRYGALGAEAGPPQTPANEMTRSDGPAIGRAARNDERRHTGGVARVDAGGVRSGESESPSQIPPPRDLIPKRQSSAGGSSAGFLAPGGDANSARGAVRSEGSRRDLDGALGDLVRRAGAQSNESSASVTPVHVSSVGVHDPRLQARTVSRGDAHERRNGAAPSYLIEAFEFALDEIVRREAERHGLEGEF